MFAKQNGEYGIEVRVHDEDVWLTQFSSKAMLKFYEGKTEGLEVVVLFSGVCKVNAAIASQLLTDVFCMDIIINSGTAAAKNL